MTHTIDREGRWNWASDSYGKVLHSRKACVYATVQGDGGDRLVTIAARIDNWDDAKLIAAAPTLLEALKAGLDFSLDGTPDTECSPTEMRFREMARYAIELAEKGQVFRADKAA